MITKLIAALNTVNCAVGKNITYNGLWLGEVAEPKSQIELQMFKIKNEC